MSLTRKSLLGICRRQRDRVACRRAAGARLAGVTRGLRSEIATLKATVDDLGALAFEATGLKNDLADLRRVLNQLRMQAR